MEIIKYKGKDWVLVFRFKAYIYLIQKWKEKDLEKISEKILQPIAANIVIEDLRDIIYAGLQHTNRNSDEIDDFIEHGPIELFDFIPIIQDSLWNTLPEKIKEAAESKEKNLKGKASN